jgi:LysM repeat protein
MNSPNPFVPQGSLLELQSKRRSRVKVAVFCVVAINVVGLMALLMQGCKREQTEAENQPPLDTNETAMMNTNPPAVEASNPPVQPPVMSQPPVVPETAGAEYVVVKGDSLWKIARKNGVTTKAIEAANPGIDPAN